MIRGSELEALDAPGLRGAAARCNVFARMLPEQKLLIVQAPRAQGAVVAMTGDGVNDAPSPKAAHIGFAMGGRGTDVAREVASLVLLDDDFGAIVKSVRMGRRIYDNLGKAMASCCPCTCPSPTCAGARRDRIVPLRAAGRHAGGHGAGRGSGGAGGLDRHLAAGAAAAARGPGRGVNFA